MSASDVDRSRAVADDLRVVRVTAALVCVNLAALVVGLVILAESAYDQSQGDFLPQDVWPSFAVLLWALALANGVGLVFWPPARLIGKGIVFGTLLAALLTIGYVAASWSAMGS